MDESPLPKWDLPHDDATGYLFDFADAVEADYEDHGSFAQDFYFPDLDDVEDVEALENEVGWYYEDEYMKAVESPWEDYSPQVFAGALNNAREAIEYGSVSDILDSLDELVGLKTRRLSLGAVEQWARITADRSLSPEDHGSPKDRASEVERQVLIAVNDLCVRLCELIAQDRSALRQIDWRQLECVIATALEGIGFDVTVTPPSKDGGKDVIATCIIDAKQLTYFVEIKHWRSGKRVNAKTVFDFVELNTECRTSGGLFLSSSGYADCVYSHLAELCRNRVRLGHEEKIVSLCQHFVRRGKGIWLAKETLPTVLIERTFQPEP